MFCFNRKEEKKVQCVNTVQPMTAESVASARTRQILVEEIYNLCRLTFQQ